MRRIEVLDIVGKDLKPNQYDWFIVGAGSESRSSFIARKLVEKGITVANVMVLYFPDVKQTVREKVKKIVRKLCPTGKLVEEEVKTDANDRIYQIMNKELNETGGSFIVDYSGMSRIWYASMLLWFYNSMTKESNVELMFLYAEGEYSIEFYNKKVVIENISIVPGCEGVVYRQVPTAAVFGLGFYGHTSLCVYDQLEPDELYTIVTHEQPLKKGAIEEQGGNRELIQRAALNFKLPLCSVLEAYRCLSDIAAFQRIKRHELILVPMGPKPHILASILVALSNPEICVLRVSHNQYLDDVKPNGRIVMSKIRFVDI